MDEIRKAAELDGIAWNNRVLNFTPQDPGQAGKDQARMTVTELAQYRVRAQVESGTSKCASGHSQAKPSITMFASSRAPGTTPIANRSKGFPTSRTTTTSMPPARRIHNSHES